MNICLTNEDKSSSDICAVSKYKDVTPELMLSMLKSGLDDFEFNSNWTDESAAYEDDVMKLIHEYIKIIEEKMPGVGLLRCANRGLEALMSIRDDEAIERSGEIWANDLKSENKKSLGELLDEDVINDAVYEMCANVQELIYKANFEELWKDSSIFEKNELCKEWDMTLGISPVDKHFESIPYTYRELAVFEIIMGRDFKEFDQFLR